MDEEQMSPFDMLDSATLSVRAIGEASRQLVACAARVQGLGQKDMEALGELVQHGQIGSSDLARRLGIRTASVTVLIDRLERAGHIRRVRDTGDRRRVSVVATDRATEVTEATWGPVITSINDLASGLSDSERAVVVDFLANVVHTINNQTAALSRVSAAESESEAPRRA